MPLRNRRLRSNPAGHRNQENWSHSPTFQVVHRFPLGPREVADLCLRKADVVDDARAASAMADAWARFVKTGNPNGRRGSGPDAILTPRGGAHAPQSTDELTAALGQGDPVRLLISFPLSRDHIMTKLLALLATTFFAASSFAASHAGAPMAGAPAAAKTEMKAEAKADSTAAKATATAEKTKATADAKAAKKAATTQKDAEKATSTAKADGKVNAANATKTKAVVAADAKQQKAEVKADAKKEEAKK